MNEKDKEAAYNTLMEVIDLLYILEIALDSDAQSSRDTKPFAFFANLIRHKITDASEILQS